MSEVAGVKSAFEGGDLVFRRIADGSEVLTLKGDGSGATIGGVAVMPATADGTTLALSAGVLGVKAAGIGGAQLATGVVKQTLLDGVDETSTPTYTITGMAAGDEVVGVIVLTTKASIATAAQRANADFTPGADALDVAANAADNSSNQLLVTWISKS